MLRISRWFYCAVTAVAATGIAGCAIGTIQTADTVGKHNFQFAVEPSAVGYIEPGNSRFKSSAHAYPSINLAARYGITEAFDLGARIGFSGLEITSKLQLTDPKDKLGTVISLAPSVGGFPASDDGNGATFYGQLPLLIGIRFGAASQLILGPRSTT